MGAGTSVVEVIVKVPIKGSKNVLSKFTRDAPVDGQTVQEYFNSSIEPMLIANKMVFGGELLRVGVTLKGADHETEVHLLADEAKMYVDFGIVRAVFYVSTAPVVLLDADGEGSTGETSTKKIADVLVREKRTELPTWTHAGRPALTQLHAKLRSMLKEQGLGFEGATDLRAGAEWMLCLVEGLYKLSPFHGRLKNRGFGVPQLFSFSEGADDFKKKGKSNPHLTKDILQHVCVIL